jgi:opacity protein-like surface antigen
MKSTRILALLVLVLAIVPAASAADFGIRAGRYDDAGNDFVGAELAFDLGALSIVPNVEYSLEDDVTSGSANIDVTVDVLTVASITPYVGAGLGLTYFDTDALGTESDLVGNLIGGVSFQLAPITPYAQVKYVRVLENEDGGEAEDDIALVVGIRF